MQTKQRQQVIYHRAAKTQRIVRTKYVYTWHTDICPSFSKETTTLAVIQTKCCQHSVNNKSIKEVQIAHTK